MRFTTVRRSRVLLIVMSCLLFPGSAARAQRADTAVVMTGTYDGGYLVFQSQDSAFKYWLDGRLQIDAAAYRGNTHPLSSGAEVRRARIGLKTTLYRDWQGEVDLDFADNAVEMKDMWIGYAGFRDSFIRIGNFKEPFSLETLTSSKNITFLERSYIDNFSPDRHMGVSYTRWGGHWSASVGVFGQTAGDIDATGRSEGYAGTGRVTFAPLLGARQVLHLGVGLSRRRPDAGEAIADSNQVRFRARPETDISQTRFLTTGRIRNVDYTNYMNGEFAMVVGPASVQAEYTKTQVHRLGERPTASFDGGYVFVSYFVTGESRPYLVRDGEFDRIHPRSRRGALEVAARYSGLDLNDPSPGVAILGGKAANYTIGVTWYINTNFKWMLNYVHVANDDNAHPDLGNAPFPTGESFRILQTRFGLAL